MINLFSGGTSDWSPERIEYYVCLLFGSHETSPIIWIEGFYFKIAFLIYGCFIPPPPPFAIKIILEVMKIDDCFVTEGIGEVDTGTDQGVVDLVQSRLLLEFLLHLVLLELFPSLLICFLKQEEILSKCSAQQ
jgi:hypothetical protein